MAHATAQWLLLLLLVPLGRAAVAVAACLILLLATIACYRACLHPLSHVPGPRLAALSSAWYAYHVRHGRMLPLATTLHRRYGPVVRVGPNELWFNSKDAFRLIYSPTSGYEKSSFYLATALLKPKLSWSLQLHSPDTLDLLAERDMRRYRMQRRLIGPVYHLSNVRQYEHAIDAVLGRVISHLKSLDGSEVDLKEWMHITVVECLGAVSLSWSPGYLRDKSDGASGKHAYLGWRRKSVFGLFPQAVLVETLSRSAGRAFASLWRVTYHTPKEGFRPFFPAVQKKISQRVKAALRPQPPKDLRRDIMADLIQLHKDRPEFSEHYLRRMAITNFGAGHETMTSTLIAVFAMLGSHAKSQGRVAEEARQTTEPISYESAARLAFTQASIKEAQRLHPVIGMSLPRTVPAAGMKLGAFHVPGGTIVGCNPISLHRNPDIFGPETDAYLPDRWLESEFSREMERYNLIYGGGARTCPGRHLAELLVSKIVPSLIRHFDVQVVIPPEKDMPHYFMAMLTGVKARFTPRKD